MAYTNTFPQLLQSKAQFGMNCSVLASCDYHFFIIIHWSGIYLSWVEIKISRSLFFISEKSGKKCIPFPVLQQLSLFSIFTLTLQVMFGLLNVYFHFPGWVAQLVGALFCTPKGCGFNSHSQGTYLGCRFDPHSACVQEATD